MGKSDKIQYILSLLQHIYIVHIKYIIVFIVHINYSIYSIYKVYYNPNQAFPKEKVIAYNKKQLYKKRDGIVVLQARVACDRLEQEDC